MAIRLNWLLFSVPRLTCFIKFDCINSHLTLMADRSLHKRLLLRPGWPFIQENLMKNVSRDTEKSNQLSGIVSCLNVVSTIICPYWLSAKCLLDGWMMKGIRLGVKLNIRSSHHRHQCPNKNANQVVSDILWERALGKSQKPGDSLITTIKTDRTWIYIRIIHRFIIARFTGCCCCRFTHLSVKPAPFNYKCSS